MSRRRYGIGKDGADHRYAHDDISQGEKAHAASGIRSDTNAGEFGR